MGKYMKAKIRNNKHIKKLKVIVGTFLIIYSILLLSVTHVFRKIFEPRKRYVSRG